MSGAGRPAAVTGARRLFFALWPDAGLRARLVAATAPAVAEAGGRAVPAENLHVTLAFLGAVPAGRVDAAVAAARAVPPASGVERFDRLAAWGRDGPLVLEPGVPGAALAELQRTLQNTLIAAGFALESRAFRPHITLARRPVRRPPATSLPPLDWPFSAFVLVDSETAAGGSRYTVSARFPALP